MRTRRSPRNQEILFRELFKSADQPPVPAPTPILTDEEIDAMWWIPRTSRSLMKRDAARARQRLAYARAEGRSGD